MTFRTRQSGSELRIEKLNSHPCAQDFDRHLCVSVSYWSLLIHHFVATTDNDLESSFIAARFASGLLVLSSAFAAVESIVKGAQTVQYNFILIATRFLFFFCNMNRKWISCAFSREPREAGAFASKAIVITEVNLWYDETTWQGQRQRSLEEWAASLGVMDALSFSYFVKCAASRL